MRHQEHIPFIILVSFDLVSAETKKKVSSNPGAKETEPENTAQHSKMDLSPAGEHSWHAICKYYLRDKYFEIDGVFAFHRSLIWSHVDGPHPTQDVHGWIICSWVKTGR
jgi:hypothetical protein